MKHSPTQGFTLLELVTVVAIVAILAAIALPSYTDYVRKSRRTEAMSFLKDQQLRLERHRTDRANFAGYTLPTGGPGSSYYNYGLTATSAAPNSYTLTATPTGSQAADECGTLRIVNTEGVVTRTPSAPRCW